MALNAHTAHNATWLISVFHFQIDLKLNKQLAHGRDDHDDSGYDHDDHDDSGYDHDDSRDDHDDSADGGSVDASATEGTATLAF